MNSPIGFLLLFILFQSCSKEEWVLPEALPVLIEQPVTKSGINHPVGFNTCYGVFNFPPERTWGWARARINGEMQHGVAWMNKSSSDSTVYKLKITFLDFENCSGLYKTRFDDIFIDNNARFEELPWVAYSYSCPTSSIIRVPFRKRVTTLSILDYDTSIQTLHPDSTIEMRPRVVVDQFNLIDSFAIGRFAGKYLNDPSCPSTGNEPYLVIEDGYFEANLIY